MPRHEDDTSDALRRLAVPPERPRFFEELRVRMQEHDRAAARRWRLTSLALGAAAVAALAAASVLAATSTHSVASGKTTVVDRTISCRVAPTHRVYIDALVTIHQAAEQNNPAYVFPANVAVATWPRYAKPNDNRSSILGQFGFKATEKGVTVDRLRCTTSRMPVPLRAAGLPSNGTNTESFKGGIRQLCSGGARVLIHYRVTEAGGLPQKALVAVRNDTKRRTPIAYIDWTPKRVTSFTPVGCSTYPYMTVP